MDTPRSLINKLGSARVAAHLGVSPGRVRQAAGDDLLPASWFFGMRDLCAAEDEELDEALFRKQAPKASDAGGAANEGL